MPPAPPIFREPHPLWIVALVTLLFALLARAVRGVSLSGAIAGGLVCFALYLSAGPAGFLLLIILFILTWGATRFGYQHKLRLGTAEKKEGRTASQVLANVGMAAVCALLYGWRGNLCFLVAVCACMAEAAADTVSSELGQSTARDAWLITSWQKVPVGTNGAISFAGTMAGIASALIICLTGMFTELILHRDLYVSWIAAIGGMVCDSYLGATLERRGLLNNNSVNFLGTLTAAAIAILGEAIL